MFFAEMLLHHQKGDNATCLVFRTWGVEFNRAMIHLSCKAFLGSHDHETGIVKPLLDALKQQGMTYKWDHSFHVLMKV